MISRIEALRYKCLHSIDQRLERFQVLVGPNASGKSTVFDTIAFISDLLQSDLEAAVRQRTRDLKELVWQGEGSRFEIALELELPEPKAKGKNGGVFTHCRYEVAVELEPQRGDLNLAAENFFLFSGDTEAEHEAQMLPFPVQVQPPKKIVVEMGERTPAGWAKVVSRNREGAAYFRSETSGWNFPMKLGAVRPALALVPEEDRFQAANWAKRTLIERTHALALDSRAMRQPCPPDAKRTYLPDGSNLPIVLRDLIQPDSDQLGRWLAHIQTVFPHIATVLSQEQESDRHPYLMTRSNNRQDRPSWLMSDGTLRLFALTLVAYLPREHQDIYLIEEPENGIHPKAIEAVFQSLSSVYDGQVLLATHSPLILGLAEPTQLLCFAQADGGATCIVRGSRHPALQDWQKDTPLATLYAAGVLG